MEPLVSIIVPIYNREMYLTKCIESICGQTYANIEVVLIDDNSEDNSLSICRKYEKIDKRIKVYKNDANMGVSYSRNIGLRISKGTYITFIDSDDYVDRYYVEVLLKVLLKSHSDISQCKIKWGCSIQSSFEMSCAEQFQICTHQSSAAAEWALQSGTDARIGGMVCAKLYAKRVWKGLNFPVGKIHEDEGVMHRVLYNAQSVACISAQLYYQIDSHSSIMRDSFSKKRYDIYDMIMDRYRFYKSKGLNDCALVTAQRLGGVLIDLYRRTKHELAEDNQELLKLYKETLPLYIESPYMTTEVKSLHMKWLTNPEYGDWYFIIPYMREHFSNGSDWQATTSIEELKHYFIE